MAMGVASELEDLSESDDHFGVPKLHADGGGLTVVTNIVEQALGLISSAPMEASGSDKEGDGVMSFSNLSDAVGILALKDDAESKEPESKPKPKTVVNRLLEEALSMPVQNNKKRRKRKRPARFESTDLGSNDEETESDREMPLAKTKSASSRSRTITLNYPLKGHLKAMVEKDRGRLSYKLPGGKPVLVRKEGDPFIGVDRCATGKYRARFASTYLGRYDTARQAAEAHDLAAVNYMEGRPVKSPKKTKGSEKKRAKQVWPSAQNLSGKTLQSSSRFQETQAQVVHREDILFFPFEDSDEEAIPIPIPDSAKGRHTLSWESTLRLEEKDVALSASKLTVKVPLRVLELLSVYDRGQYFITEMMDERGQTFMFKAYLMVVGKIGYLSIHGKWGKYARSRQLSATDEILFLLSVNVARRQTKFFPTVNLMGHVRVKRHVDPPSIRILEANVESEVEPECLGFCYAPGRLSGSVVKEALKQMKTMKELPEILRHKQDVFQKVKYRMRVVPVDPNRGFGVWVLEGIPKGEHLFEYAGEVVSSKIAASREAAYLAKGMNGKLQGKPAPHYIYEILPKGRKDAKGESGQQPPPKPVIILDSTYFGNVSRFVNHRCKDANLEVHHISPNPRYKITGSGTDTHRLIFKAKRDIAPGEELTVDYSPTKSPDQLKKSVRCYCGSPFCRGWLF